MSAQFIEFNEFIGSFDQKIISGTTCANMGKAIGKAIGKTHGKTIGKAIEMK